MSFTNESIKQNVDIFCDPLSDKDINELSLYLCFRLTDTPPNELQKEFIDEFFGHDNWAEMINELNYPPAFFFRSANTQHLWGKVRELVLVKVTERFNRVLAEKALLENEKQGLVNKINIAKTEEDLLKSELRIAFLSSFDDGIFDKCEGWCNISDVLVEKGLLKLKEKV